MGWAGGWVFQFLSGMCGTGSSRSSSMPILGPQAVYMSAIDESIGLGNPVFRSPVCVHGWVPAVVATGCSGQSLAPRRQAWAVNRAGSFFKSLEACTSSGGWGRLFFRPLDGLHRCCLWQVGQVDTQAPRLHACVSARVAVAVEIILSLLACCNLIYNKKV